MKEHFIAAKDGIKTYVLELDAIGPQTGAPIFLIHGLSRNHKDFSEIFDFLRTLGRKVYAIDVRGRGKSDRDPNYLNYHPLTYATDVLNIFTELKIEPAIFIGTSMGGLISMILASFAPKIFKAIVLNDVGPEVDEMGITRIRNYVGNIGVMKNWDDAAQTIKDINISAFPNRADDNKFWLDFAKKTCIETDDGIAFDYDEKISVNLKPVEGAPPADLWPQFNTLKDIPTMVIRGKLSDILTPKIIDKMLVINANLVVENVDNVGHAPILNEPQSIAALEKFIKNNV